MKFKPINYKLRPKDYGCWVCRLTEVRFSLSYWYSDKTWLLCCTDHNFNTKFSSLLSQKQAIELIRGK